MDTPLIRLATEQDIDQLISLYIEFHEFHVPGVPERLRRPEVYDEAELRDALRAIFANPDAALFVADAGKELLGLAEVYLHQDEPQMLTVAHRYGYLQSLIVSAAQRKKGVGKQLVMAAQQWAKERDATEMQLTAWEFAAGPLPFYEALGYRTLKRHFVIDLN